MEFLPLNNAMIKINDSRFRLDAIKSYSYSDGVLCIEFEEDYDQFNIKETPDLDDIVKTLDEYLLVNNK